MNREYSRICCRVMCLGDSITDGFWMTGGYRNELCERIFKSGLSAQIQFTGPNWGGTGYDPRHAGYSGYSIENIAQSDSISGCRTGITGIIGWLMGSYPADIVFLQIGTNDILSLYALETFGVRLERLIDEITAYLPQEGMLYLATLPPMDAKNGLYISRDYFTEETMDAAVAACNRQIRALAKKKERQGAAVRLAEVSHVLEKKDLYDGVHPSESGYRKLGAFWFSCLLAYLNDRCSADNMP